MVFSIFTELYKHSSVVKQCNFRTLLLYDICPYPHPLVTTNLFSVSLDLPLLDISYKWHHIICGPLWLVSLTFPRFIHAVARYQNFLFIAELYSIVWIYHTMEYFVCLSSPKLTDIWIVFTLLLLQIMLVWTFVHKFLCGHMFSFLLGIYLGVESPGHI